MLSFKWVEGFIEIKNKIIFNFSNLASMPLFTFMNYIKYFRYAVVYFYELYNIF